HHRQGLTLLLVVAALWYLLPQSRRAVRRRGDGPRPDCSRHVSEATMTIERVRTWLPGSMSALVVGMMLANTHVLRAETITVLSSNGFKAVLRELAPQFENVTGHEVAISYSVSAELKKRIEN